VHHRSRPCGCGAARTVRQVTTPAAPTLDDVEAALARSHETLAAAVSHLDAEQLGGPSYDAEWTVADVLSHLGSGAEISTLLLESGLAGGEGPGFDAFSRIWDVWNAKSPQQQAADSLAANAAFLERVGTLPEEQRRTFSVEMFNGRQDLLGMVQLRLAEHAVHTWDVLVVADPHATVARDATVLLLPGLDDLVARAGQRSEVPLRVAVRTSDPEAAFLLEADGDGPRLTPGGDGAAEASLQLPAEAFIRLVYGRLDPAHTPPVQADGVDLAALRTIFPGF
jgi:uncharacterized protein (TIGR03083 family)